MEQTGSINRVIDVTYVCHDDGIGYFRVFYAIL